MKISEHIDLIDDVNCYHARILWLAPPVGSTQIVNLYLHHSSLKSKNKYWFVRNQVNMSLSGATCRQEECCFSEVAL